MATARRSGRQIEDPVRSPSAARRGPTVSGPRCAGGPLRGRRLAQPPSRSRLRRRAGAVGPRLPPRGRHRRSRPRLPGRPRDRCRGDPAARTGSRPGCATPSCSSRRSVAGWTWRSAPGRVAWSIAFVGPELIDRINILQATLLASTLAAARLQIRPDALLLDAVSLPEVRVHQRVLVSADGCAPRWRPPRSWPRWLATR